MRYSCFRRSEWTNVYLPAKWCVLVQPTTIRYYGTLRGSGRRSRRHVHRYLHGHGRHPCKWDLTANRFVAWNRRKKRLDVRGARWLISGLAGERLFAGGWDDKMFVWTQHRGVWAWNRLAGGHSQRHYHWNRAQVVRRSQVSCWL
jgi:hypothetical protein